MPGLPLPHEPRPDDPYRKRWIEQHGEQPWRDLARMPELDPAKAVALLRDLVASACTATHFAMTNLGRWGVLAMPRGWVISKIRPILEDVISRGDDWEYRRALELASFLDDQLVAELVVRGASSDDPHVREAAAELDADRDLDR